VRVMSVGFYQGLSGIELRIKGLYMFRALLAHPQEALHKRHLVYCVRVISVGFYQGLSGIEFHSNPGSSQQT
jgi:hypothetical protein